MSLPSGPLIFVFIYLPPPFSPCTDSRKSPAVLERRNRTCLPDRNPNSVAINLRGANKEDSEEQGGGKLRVSSEINIDGENEMARVINAIELSSR